MKATIKSTAGENIGQIELPAQFNEEIRPDLIKRAVLSVQSHKRQPYGADPEAGKKYSSKISRRRRNYKGAYGIGISRVPRKIMSHRGTRFNWQAAAAPNTVGGRQAHPPQVDRILIRKINSKERKKAIRSALSASVIKELVTKRGHVVGEYPLVLDNNVETIKKTKEFLAVLEKLGFEKELERSSKKTQKTGKARLRGRSSKGRKGPLIVVSEKCALLKAAVNIPGIDIVDVSSLNAELLAPGCICGRLTLYTKGAIEKIQKSRLFMENTKIIEEIKPGKKTVKRAAKKVAEE